MRNLIIILLIIMVSSCDRVSQDAVTGVTTLDTTTASCPNITKDAQGNFVISYVRSINDSTHEFCYAISKDAGKTFGDPIVVKGSNTVFPHNENLPKIIFKPSGEIIAVWGAKNPNPKNKYSGLVYYTSSRDNGQSWTEVQPLVKDTASFDQRYFDVALMPNGEAAIIWLDNRKTVEKDGSALYFSTTHADHGFMGEQLISQPTCQCCRTDLYVDKKGNVHVLYRGIIQDSIRDMLHMVSTDAGKTFSAPQTISKDNWVIYGCPHTGPAQVANDYGMHFAWFTGGKVKGTFYNNTTDMGASFTPRDSISEKGMHPQITSFSDGKLGIVYDASKDTATRQIYLQIRDPKGKLISNESITSQTSISSYPVASTDQHDNLLIAFTIKEGKRTRVAYRAERP